MTLDQLLTTWRTTRHPRIADAIDLVAASSSRKALPNQKAWLAHAKALKPGDTVGLDALLDIASWPRGAQLAIERIAVLAKRPADPRIAKALGVLVTTAPLEGVHGFVDTAYRDACKLLVEIGDQRQFAVLTAGKAASKPLPITRQYWAHKIPAKVPKLTKKLEAQLAIVEQATAPVVAKQRAAGARLEDLLAAVYKKPDDLAARAVYADALIERGDPQGELIQLQLRTGDYDVEAHRRELALVDKVAPALAQHFTHFFDDNDFVLAGGFFGGDTFQIGDMDLDRPEWRLVRELSSEKRRPLFLTKVLIALARDKRLRSLRALAGLDRVAALAIAKHGHATLERFELAPYGPYDKEMAGFATLESLPALHTLGLSGVPESWHAWLAKAPVLERVHRATLVAYQAKVPLELLAKRGGALREIELRSYPYNRAKRFLSIVLRRDSEDGPFSTLVIRQWGRTFDVRNLVEALAQIPARQVKRIVATTTRTTKLPPHNAKLVKEAFARFTSAERDTMF